MHCHTRRALCNGASPLIVPGINFYSYSLLPIPFLPAATILRCKTLRKPLPLRLPGLSLFPCWT